MKYLIERYTDNKYYKVTYTDIAITIDINVLTLQLLDRKIDK
jgi:hypothetical protein